MAAWYDCLFIHPSSGQEWTHGSLCSCICPVSSGVKSLQQPTASQDSCEGLIAECMQGIWICRENSPSTEVLVLSAWIRAGLHGECAAGLCRLKGFSNGVLATWKYFRYSRWSRVFCWNSSFWLKNIFTYFVCVGSCIPSLPFYKHGCQKTTCRSQFFFSTWESNSCGQVCWQPPLSSEPFHQSLLFIRTHDTGNIK